MMMSQIRSQASAARRRAGGDGGFTLVELMVVVLVIAILLAIAIPTFLGARERSQDRAAQSNLRNALTAAKVAYSNDGDYANASDTGLVAIEPRLTYEPETTESTTESVISVDNPVGTWTASATPGACFLTATLVKFTPATNTAAGCTTASGTWIAHAAGTGYCGVVSSTSTILEKTYNTQATCTGASFSWSGAVWSASDRCWYITDNSEGADPTGGTRYGEGTDVTDCRGDHSLANATKDDW